MEEYVVKRYEAGYAEGFEILGAEGRESSVIVTRTPWQGADSAAVTRVFVQRDAESVPEGFEGQVVRGEACRIVCMSSTHVALLDAVGAADRVVGVSGIDFVSNRYVQSKREEIVDVGYDGNIDYERLVAADADLVLLYGVNGVSGMEGKLRELGIPFMYVGEYLEESPLGKAEWMVAVAELVGKRQEGVMKFLSIPQRYNELKVKAARALVRPKVMINTPYGDSWLMASTESYVARLIRDAGGEYVYTQNEGKQSLPIDMEEAYRLTAEADVWLNVGQMKTMEELLRLCPKFADTKPVVTGQVWNTILRATPSGSNDYWESGVVQPHLVLQDLVMLLHPGLLNADFTYYKRLE